MGFSINLIIRLWGTSSYNQIVLLLTMFKCCTSSELLGWNFDLNIFASMFFNFRDGLRKTIDSKISEKFYQQHCFIYFTFESYFADRAFTTSDIKSQSYISLNSDNKSL